MISKIKVLIGASALLVVAGSAAACPTGSHWTLFSGCQPSAGSADVVAVMQWCELAAARHYPNAASAVDNVMRERAELRCIASLSQPAANVR